MEQHFEGFFGRVHRRVLRAANRVSHADGRARRLLRPLYSAVLHVASGGRGIPGRINGEMYRLDPRYRWRLWPNYEEELSAWLRARIGPGDYCVNVGANIGLHVLQMARWASRGHVLAFEPNPGSFDVLRDHVRMNRLGDRVTLVQSAIGRAPGTARLFDTNAGSGLSRLGEPNPAIEGPADSLEVPVVTLDDWLDAAGAAPDVVLVDVEGFEFDVLDGARRLLANPRALVVVEMHPHLWPGGKADSIEAARLLTRLGRRPVAIDGRPDPWSEGQSALEPIATQEP